MLAEMSGKERENRGAADVPGGTGPECYHGRIASGLYFMFQRFLDEGLVKVSAV